MVAETVVLETTQKFASVRARRDAYAQFTAEPAHSYGVYMTGWWLVTTAVLGSLLFFANELGYVYAETGLYLSGEEFLVFWAVWGTATSYAVYKVMFHFEKYRLRHVWLEFISQPTEITEREIVGDTSVLDYQEIPHNMLGVVSRHRRPKTIGTLQFSGMLIQALALSVENGSVKIRRDPTDGANVFSWRRDAPADVQNEYMKYRKALGGAGYVNDSNYWTQEGRDWLEVDPPTATAPTQ